MAFDLDENKLAVNVRHTFMLSRHMQILAIMVMVGIISCKEEDTKPTPEKLVPVTVEFGEDIIVLENNGLREIVLEFDNPSQGEGEISLVQSATLDGIDISDMDDSGNIDLLLRKEPYRRQSLSKSLITFWQMRSVSTPSKLTKYLRHLR